MKLFIRVKFRAMGVTFATVERELSIDSLVHTIFKAVVHVLKDYTNVPGQDGLWNRIRPLVPSGYPLYDYRGVYVEVR